MTSLPVFSSRVGWLINFNIINRTIIGIFLLLLPGLGAAADLAHLQVDPDALEQHRQKDKWLVVMIWASDCVACNQEAHQYVDFHEFHSDRNATVLGISLDGSSQAAAKSFIDRHGVTFPNLITDFDTGALWFESLTGQKFLGTPGFLILDPQGEIRAQQIGAVPASMIEQFIESHSAGDQAAAN